MTDDNTTDLTTLSKERLIDESIDDNIDIKFPEYRAEFLRRLTEGEADTRRLDWLIDWVWNNFHVGKSRTVIDENIRQGKGKNK